ncbi:MAG TPA: GNAT family N-acetyltransferase [Ilumatobacteraceae bacterium]|nr:GNAT family N-acetyltransferase [Ilumatobacteraceae bacterium]
MTPRCVDPAAEWSTLDAMDGIMQDAYGVLSFRTSIDRFAAVQPDGLAVIEQAGTVVGAGCCVAYPDGGFGWIGLVATAPRFERQGIATAITEYLSGVLDGYGCAAVLDASAAGGPVYERMGFVDHGLTRVMGYVGGDPPAANVDDCEPLTAADLDEVVRFDVPRFGATRRELLAKAIDQHPGRALVLRRRGKVAGYLVAQESTLGPVVADTSESLTSLIIAALRLEWASPPRISVPPESGHVATLQRLGFETRRELRHMRRGIDVLPGRRESVAAQVSLGEG